MRVGKGLFGEERFEFGFGAAQGDGGADIFFGAKGDGPALVTGQTPFVVVGIESEVGGMK